MKYYISLFGHLVSFTILFATITGCVERTISITSEPPGALLFLNDHEIGRTPCTTDFKFYGTYDVRLTLDGYEPYMGPGEANAPLYQQPGIDFLADIIPIKLHDTVNWHFKLREVDSTPEKMLDRAEQLRAKLKSDILRQQSQNKPSPEKPSEDNTKNPDSPG